MLLSALQVQFAPVTCSPSCLVLSEDGQVAALSGPELLIWTPQLGFASSAHAATYSGKPSGSATTLGDPVPFLKASVEQPGRTQWADYSNNVHNVTPGMSLPTTRWRAACWSPSGLNSSGGCLLVAVTYNYEVIVYEPTSNPLTGVWTPFSNITEALVAELLAPELDGAVEEAEAITAEASAAFAKMAGLVARTQTICAQWSHALPLHGAGDRSLLALGHKSGHVSLWRKNANGMELVESTSKLIDGTPNHLAWSPWTTSQDGSAHAKLIIADHRGAITLVEYSQTIDTLSSNSRRLVEADSRPVSQLSYLLFGHQPVIAYTKTGTVSLVYADGKTHELELEPSGNWPLTNPWAPATALLKNGEDSLIVMLTDGSCHLVESIQAGTPVLVYSTDSPRSSQALSARFRTAFEALEANHLKLRKQLPAIMKTSGAVAIGGHLLWMYGLSWPTATDHTPESKQISIAALAPLEPPSDSIHDALKLVRQAVLTPVSVLASSPLRLVMPALLSLRSHPIDDLPEDFALPLMQVENTDLPLQLGGLSIESQIRQVLFSSAVLNELRLRLFVARACLTWTKDAQFKTAVDALNGRIGQLVHTRLAELSRSIALDNEVDAAILARFEACVTVHQLKEAGLELPTESTVSGIHETCPACNAEVKLTDARYGTCATGHVFERCSLTLALIGSSKTRACTGCRRQVLLGAEGQLGRALIGAAQVCVFCGGGWSAS